MMRPRALCDGTQETILLAVGVMSRPDRPDQRDALRHTWGLDDHAVLPCFLVGKTVKRTPLPPWAAPAKRAKQNAEADPPRGQTYALPQLANITLEHATYGDVLALDDSFEIEAGGSSGLKTLPWWRHASLRLPNARWIGKADDDTFLNVPLLRTLLPDPPSPRALLGTVRWGCYSAARFKHERTNEGVACGHSKFARAQHPGEPVGLSQTYEGPYAFAYGWFYAMPGPLARTLAGCEYVRHFHTRATTATAEPFFRKEDDPMNGFWIYKCLKESNARVEPLPSLDPRSAHNSACISQRGLYRTVSNDSVVAHFLKHPSAMYYAAAKLKLLRGGGRDSIAGPSCCTKMVWPISASARKTPNAVCEPLLKCAKQCDENKACPAECK